MKYAVVWPEGQPYKAKFASSARHCFWLEFWLGIKTWWPTPIHARRVRTLVLCDTDRKWLAVSKEGSVTIATCAEGGIIK